MYNDKTTLIKNHWCFTKYIWAILPEGSLVLPMFVWCAFADDSNQVPLYGKSTRTTQIWYIHKDNIFEAPDLEIWDGASFSRQFSEIYKHEEYATTFFSSPREDALMGRIYTAISFALEDLQPYIKI